MVEINNESTPDLLAHYFARNGDMYIKGGNNPNADNIFEMNHLLYLNRDVSFEGTIPLEGEDLIWVRNPISSPNKTGAERYY